MFSYRRTATDSFLLHSSVLHALSPRHAITGTFRGPVPARRLLRTLFLSRLPPRRMRSLPPLFRCHSIATVSVNARGIGWPSSPPGSERLSILFAPVSRLSYSMHAALSSKSRESKCLLLLCQVLYFFFSAKQLLRALYS